mmetsp:Transcript_2682/g.6424  ORF Transcript_2682/g.6424 Transcript_2682/m.6424 type:complete len:84 (-) Transcript_2682:863-1114(-)
MVERTRSGDYAEDFTVEINSDPPEPSVSESGLLYRQTVPTSEKPLRHYCKSIALSVLLLLMGTILVVSGFVLLANNYDDGHCM